MIQVNETPNHILLISLSLQIDGLIWTFFFFFRTAAYCEFLPYSEAYFFDSF